MHVAAHTANHDVKIHAGVAADDRAAAFSDSNDLPEICLRETAGFLDLVEPKNGVNSTLFRRVYFADTFDSLEIASEIIKRPIKVEEMQVFCRAGGSRNDVAATLKPTEFDPIGIHLSFFLSNSDFSLFHSSQNTLIRLSIHLVDEADQLFNVAGGESCQLEDVVPANRD